MAKISKATFARMAPWAVAGAICVLFCWNMKQCSGLDDANDANAAQDAKIAQVNSVVKETADAAARLAKVVSDLDNKEKINNENIVLLANRMDNAEERLDSVEARVDSLQVCAEKMKKMCANRKKQQPVQRDMGVSGCKSDTTSVARDNKSNVATTDVDIQNGCNNTVNINNGVVNNYYGEPKSTPCEQASAPEVVGSVQRTYRIKITKVQCR